MNKKDIVRLVAEKTGFSMVEIAKILNSYKEVIGEVLQVEDELQILGLVKIYKKELPARVRVLNGVEHDTPAKITLDAKVLGKFKKEHTFEK